MNVIERCLSDELVRVGRQWLNENASPHVGLCNDGTCVRCRLASALNEIENRFISVEENSEA